MRDSRRILAGLLATSLLAFASVSLAQTTSVISSGAVALAVPDNAYDGTQASMACSTVDASSIPAGDTVVGATVTAAVDHTWVGDVTLKLVSPAGSVLTLLSRPDLAETADDGSGCCGASSDLVSTSPITFDDAAANDAENMGATEDPICAGAGICDYFPNPGAAATPPASFADLAGENASGNWMLCFGDSGGGDLGTLQSWDLTVVHQAGGGTTTPGAASVPVPSTGLLGLLALASLLIGGAWFGLRRGV